jgi:uncharacterized protein (TIGR02246 family)
MRTITLFILFLLLYSCGTDSNDTSVKYNSTDDSLALVKMVNERETAMKKKDIRTVIAQFSEDATFINGEGYYCANKTEIEAFHKGLTQSDSVGYYYTAGQVHVRMLDNNNALVYYPNRMDWFKISNPKGHYRERNPPFNVDGTKKKRSLAVGCNYKSTNTRIF